jgi:hypothetical protein
MSQEPSSGTEGYQGVSVLNGLVYPGDMVAYAVRDGNLAAIRIGRVTGSRMRKSFGRDILVLRIRVTQISDFGSIPGKEVGIEKLDRVVKLNPTAADAYPVQTCRSCKRRVRRQPLGGGWLMISLREEGYTSYCESGTDNLHEVASYDDMHSKRSD